MSSPILSSYTKCVRHITVEWLLFAVCVSVYIMANIDEKFNSRDFTICPQGKLRSIFKRKLTVWFVAVAL